MSSLSPKRQLFEQFSDLARALGHAHRLELIEQLAQGERSVEALAGKIGQSVANTSQHLQQMRRAGLVETRRDGKRVIYRLADGPVLEAVAGLRELAEANLAEVREIVGAYFTSKDDLEPVSREELATRLRTESVTLLDLRPEDEFALGHLPGALNIPLDQLEARLAELQPEREIIAYCRGPYCVLSFEAVALLRARGLPVRRLEDGFPEWRAAGLRVEAGQG
ncbi:MAG: metalloregulator ArsR/SmtB family transcription factor [Microcystis sp. LE19-4.1E]|jgi:rhodanese-related sulfurtransferase/DNA-binding transcriptional ArsR family regulator|nr:metalloregulator ArsR/SmtB family transcription factor [Microcystis sp. LE19-4.1E]